MIHRARLSWSVWYWDGGSITFFKYGVHIRRRHEWEGAQWRSYRLAFFSKKPHWNHRRLLDFSMRDTEKANSKPVRPCWRVWIDVGAGRTPSRRGLYGEFEDARATNPRGESKKETDARSE